MKLLVIIILPISFWGMGPSTAFAQENRVKLGLEQFLEEVAKSSLDLSIEDANLKSFEARAQGVRIKAPTLGYMWMDEGEQSRHGYGASQELPFPSKIFQEKKTRNLEYEAQKASTEYQRFSVLAEAQIAYVDFWRAYTREILVKEKIAWLKNHLKRVQAIAWAETSAKLQFYDLESMLDLLEVEALSLEAELVAKRNALRIFAPHLQVNTLQPLEPPVPSASIKKPSSGAEIKWKERELQALEAIENLTKQSYLPDFFITFTSYNGNGVSPPNQETMVGISLPFLFFWQPRAEVAEASAQTLKARAELQKSKINFESKLTNLTAKLESIEAQIKNLNERVIPRAKKRVKLISNVSTRTLEGLAQHRSAELGLIDLKLKSIDLRFDQASTISELIKLTGQTAELGIR